MPQRDKNVKTRFKGGCNSQRYHNRGEFFTLTLKMLCLLVHTPKNASGTIRYCSELYLVWPCLNWLLILSTLRHITKDFRSLWYLCYSPFVWCLPFCYSPAGNKGSMSVQSSCICSPENSLVSMSEAKAAYIGIWLPFISTLYSITCNKLLYLKQMALNSS